MAERHQAREGWAPLPLAVGYLVWELCSAVVSLGLLIASTLVCAGVAGASYVVPDTVLVLGLSVPLAAILVLSWVVAVPLAVSGVLFAACVLASRARPVSLGRVRLLGRVALVACGLSLAISLVNGNAVAALLALVSGALTLALRRELDHASEEDALECAEGAEAAERSSARAIPEAMGKEARHLHRLCLGYCTIMVVWGIVRVLAGLALLFGTNLAVVSIASTATAIIAGLTLAMGIYLVAIGRVGRHSLEGSSSLRHFFVLGAVGAAVSAGVLAAWLILRASGLAIDSSDALFAVLDCALCCVACLYAYRLHRATT